MPFACKICILTRGLHGSEIGSLSETEEELFEHLKSVHGLVVKRDGETEEQAWARCKVKYKKPKFGEAKP